MDSDKVRIAQLEADVALLARKLAATDRHPGVHARWSAEDHAALEALLHRRDPQPERDADTYEGDPTDWEAQEQPHDDLGAPARPA